MRRHANKKPSIEIDIVAISQNETEVNRKYINAEGLFPSLIVALFSFLVLGTFGKINFRFLSGIKTIIGKLLKHNYFFYGLQKL